MAHEPPHGPPHAPPPHAPPPMPAPRPGWRTVGMGRHGPLRFPPVVVVERFAPVEYVSSLHAHDAWRGLWEDHIAWTRAVILAVLDGAPAAAAAAYVSRLLTNPLDMEAALAPYYAREDVAALGALLVQHLTVATQILAAAKAGDTAQLDALVAQWDANADALAAQMAHMNPARWPYAAGQPMWRAHLAATLDEATAHLAGDYAGELAAWERVHAGAVEMADFFSAGLVQQFPDRFRLLAPTY